MTNLKKANAVINRKIASEALHRQAIKIGICNFLGFFRVELISKLAADAFPLNWLEMAFPHIFNEAKDHGYEWITSALHQPLRYSAIWPFFLAASVLFENSDEALFALTNLS